MSDANRTQMISGPPSADPNRTVMGSPTVEATQTIKPVQCPVCKTFNPPGVMFCIECGLIFDRALPGDVFGAPVVRLPCFVDSAGREHPLRPGANVIGRQGDVLVDDSRVSRRHAQATVTDGTILVEDLGSTNGTTVNDEPLPTGEQRGIQAGDRVSLGGCEIVLSLPGESVKTEMGLSGRTTQMSAPPTAIEAKVFLVTSAGGRWPLKDGVNTFGRKAENDVAIPDPYVSGRHGEIEVADDGIYVTDIGSTNGTLLNEVKLNPSERTPITPEDVIRLGGVELRIEVPG